MSDRRCKTIFWLEISYLPLFPWKAAMRFCYPAARKEVGSTVEPTLFLPAGKRCSAVILNFP